MTTITNSYLNNLSRLKESEDHVEFKEANRNFIIMEGPAPTPKSVVIVF